MKNLGYEKKYNNFDLIADWCWECIDTNNFIDLAIEELKDNKKEKISCLFYWKEIEITRQDTYQSIMEKLNR